MNSLWIFWLLFFMINTITTQQLPIIFQPKFIFCTLYLFAQPSPHTPQGNLCPIPPATKYGTPPSLGRYPDSSHMEDFQKQTSQQLLWGFLLQKWLCIILQKTVWRWTLHLGSNKAMCNWALLGSMRRGAGLLKAHANSQIQSWLCGSHRGRFLYKNGNEFEAMMGAPERLSP